VVEEAEVRTKTWMRNRVLLWIRMWEEFLKWRKRKVEVEVE